jgi:hypothetical protein
MHRASAQQTVYWADFYKVAERAFATPAQKPAPISKQGSLIPAIVPERAPTKVAGQVFPWTVTAEISGTPPANRSDPERSLTVLMP